MDDTATYECTVTNDAGEDTRTVDLTVQGRTGLVCGLKVIIMISFLLFTTSQRASFSTYQTFTFNVEKEGFMSRLWKSVRVGNM